MTPKFDDKQQDTYPEPRTESPVLVRQADDSVVVFGPRPRRLQQLRRPLLTSSARPRSSVKAPQSGAKSGNFGRAGSPSCPMMPLHLR